MKSLADTTDIELEDELRKRQEVRHLAQLIKAGETKSVDTYLDNYKGSYAVRMFLRASLEGFK